MNSMYSFAKIGKNLFPIRCYFKMVISISGWLLAGESVTMFQNLGGAYVLFIPGILTCLKCTGFGLFHFVLTIGKQIQHQAFIQFRTPSQDMSGKKGHSISIQNPE